jgi:ribosomal protein L11 methyltransferase
LIFVSVYQDAFQDTEKFSIVVANILANPLKILAPAIGALVAPRGYLALSGILEQQAQDIIAIYAPWANLQVWQVADGWVCLAGPAK